MVRAAIGFMLELKSNGGIAIESIEKLNEMILPLSEIEPLELLRISEF
jgi:hypothetical protein